MKRIIVVLVVACAACGKKPAPPARGGGGGEGERRDAPARGGEASRGAPRRALAPRARIELPPEETRKLAWEVKLPEKLADERGKIMCFFKDEFETGTTLGWENVEIVDCPGRAGQCLILAPAPDGRSAVSARLQQDKIFAQSRDFLMTLFCAADLPVEVTLQVSSEKSPGVLFEKRLKLDEPDRWVRFDFPTSEFKSGDTSLPEGGMVSELIVRAGQPGQDVKFLLDNVRIYMRLPEELPHPEPAPVAAKESPPARLPPGALFLSDFERGSDGWSGRRITRRGGGRALAGVEAKRAVRSISVSKVFDFEVKRNMRLTLSCRFAGEGAVMIALFGEKGGYYLLRLSKLKDGEWVDLDVPVEGKGFLTLDGKPLEKGTAVKIIALVAAGEAARELQVDDVMLYVSKEPVAPPTSPVPALASGPDWFDLFDGRTLDGWQEPYPITWTVKEKSLHASAPFQEGYLYTRESFADFEMQLRLRPGRSTPGKPEVRLKFRWNFDEASGYEFRAGKKAVLVKCGEGGDETLATADLGREIEKGRACVVGILARGRRIECRINGRDVASASVEGPAEGAVGLGVFHGEVFVEAVKMKEIE